MVKIATFARPENVTRKLEMMIRTSFFAILVLGLTSCNKHYLTYQLVDQQLNVQNLNNETKAKVAHYGLYEHLKVLYEPNGLAYVICFEKKTDRKVKLSINKDTTLVIIDKANKKHRLYFDTVFLADSVVYGLKSRFLGLPLAMPVSQIDKFEIHAELSSKTVVND